MDQTRAYYVMLLERMIPVPPVASAGKIGFLQHNLFIYKLYFFIISTDWNILLNFKIVKHAKKISGMIPETTKS